MAIQNNILQSFIHSFHDMFLLAIPFALGSFVVALFLKEAPLREHTHLPSELSEDIESHSPIAS
jgi:hypothetical protein